jgi:hypothetical protein
MNGAAFVGGLLWSIPVVITGIAFVAGCSAKVEVKSTPVAASAPEVTASAPSPEPAVPVQDMLGAILRVSDRISQACYDGKTESGNLIFFIQYKPSPDDDFGTGWRQVDSIKFLQTDAGKYYIQAPDREEYGAVYPDVTGLQCKQQ